MKTTKKKYVQQDTTFHLSEEGEDINASEKYFRIIPYWIGSFVMEFNSFEESITDKLGWKINHADVRGYEHIFLTGLSYSQKVELLNRLYKYSISFENSERKQKILKQEADNIITQLKDIGKVRNSIVHSDYYSYDENGKIKEKIRLTEFDIEENWIEISKELIVEYINLMYDVIENIEEFTSKLMF